MGTSLGQMVGNKNTLNFVRGYTPTFQFLTADQLSMEIHASARWIVEHAKALGGVKVAGKWLFRLEDVAAAVKSGIAGIGDEEANGS